VAHRIIALAAFAAALAGAGGMGLVREQAAGRAPLAITGRVCGAEYWSLAVPLDGSGPG
jgi:hypothetical protein